MPKPTPKLKLKKTVDSDATNLVTPKPGYSNGYNIDNPEYRGMRIKIKLKNPRGYSGKEVD